MALLDKVISTGTRAFMTLILGLGIIAVIVAVVWFVILIPVSILNMSPLISIPYPDLIAFLVTMLDGVAQLAQPYVVILFGEAAVGMTQLIILGGIAIIIGGGVLKALGGGMQNDFLIQAGASTELTGQTLVTQGGNLTRTIIQAMKDLSGYQPPP